MKHYDSKWSLFILLSLGLGGRRCSEISALQIKDFVHDFHTVKIRQAKSNDIIEEPVPEALRKLVIGYISLNSHRMIDGYLFTNYTGKGLYHSTESINGLWRKWRHGCAKEFNNSRWLDNYSMPSKRHLVARAIKNNVNKCNLHKITGISRVHLRVVLMRMRKTGHLENTESLQLTAKGVQLAMEPEYEVRFRICSHSIRRLHRTLLRKKLLGQGMTEYIIAKLCNYQDFNSYLRYINEFEELEHKADIVLPHLNPLMAQISSFSHGQTQLGDFQH